MFSSWFLHEHTNDSQAAETEPLPTMRRPFRMCQNLCFHYYLTTQKRRPSPSQIVRINGRGGRIRFVNRS